MGRVGMNQTLLDDFSSYNERHTVGGRMDRGYDHKMMRRKEGRLDIVIYQCISSCKPVRKVVSSEDKQTVSKKAFKFPAKSRYIFQDVSA